ncbi:MAG: PorT family protein [Saprospiraceae bacterium]|nr:PorT family protein [Saprospiraceae bacterium]
MRNHPISHCIILLFLFGGLPTQAQKLGLEGGFNTSNMVFDAAFEGIFDFEVKTNFQIGLWGEIPIGESWGLRPSLLYLRRGAQNQPNSSAGQTVNVNYDYLDIPLLVYLGRGTVQFRLGGAVGIPVDHFLYDTANDRRLEGNLIDDFWDTGVNFSLMGGFALQFQRFHVSIQYQHGITPTIKDIVFTDVNGEPIKEENGGEHRNVLISLGYTLWGK